jgi:hypothetical protein
MDVTRTYFLAASATETDLLEFRRALIANGARHVNMFLPDVIVCELPPGFDTNSLPGHKGVVRTDETAISALRAPVLSHRLGWIKMCYQRSEDIRKYREVSPLAGAKGVHPEGFNDVVVLPTPEKTRRAKQFLKAAGFESRDARGITQNSEFFGGDILVQLVLPESNGQFDNNDEDWEDDQVSNALSAAYAGMLSIQGRFPRMSMHFVFRNYVRAETGYEAIRHKMGEDEQWITDVIYRIDPTLPTGNPQAQVHAFNEKAREETKVDFVFTGFVANSEHAPNHMFWGANYTAYANLGGPYNIQPFPAGRDPNSIGDWLVFSQIFEHETGHVFWTLDEYLASDGFCTDRSGYLNYDNLNKLLLGPDGEFAVCTPDGRHDCLMQNAAREDLGGPWCFWSQGQMGVVDDVDGSGQAGVPDGIPDIFNSKPKIEFESTAVDTVSSSDVTFRIKAISTAVENKNKYQSPDEMIHYAAPLEEGTYTVMGINGSIMPEDGIWDEVEEDCLVRISGLPYDTMTVACKVRTLRRNWSGQYTKKIFHVGVNFGRVGVAAQPGGNRFHWKVVDEKSNAAFDVYRLDPGEEMPGHLIKSDVPPAGPDDRHGERPYQYVDEDVIPGLEYSYYVVSRIRLLPGGKVYTRRTDVVSNTAMIPIPSGVIISNAAPNPFRDHTTLSISIPPTYKDLEINSGSGGTGNFLAQVATAVDVAVFDVAGRRVKTLRVDKVFDPVVTLSWDGTNTKNESVPSGIYFVRAQAGDVTGVSKVLLIR